MHKNPYEHRRYHSDYMRRWYADPVNRELQKVRSAHARRAMRARRRQLVDRLKSVPCMDCGGRFDPECMDFDHRDGTTKVRDVANFTAGQGTVAGLLAEIAKCDVVCANCHRLRTKARRKPGPTPRRDRPIAATTEYVQLELDA